MDSVNSGKPSFEYKLVSNEEHPSGECTTPDCHLGYGHKGLCAVSLREGEKRTRGSCTTCTAKGVSKKRKQSKYKVGNCLFHESDGKWYTCKVTGVDKKRPGVYTVRLDDGKLFSNMKEEDLKSERPVLYNDSDSDGVEDEGLVQEETIQQTVRTYDVGQVVWHKFDNNISYKGKVTKVTKVTKRGPGVYLYQVRFDDDGEVHNDMRWDELELDGMSPSQATPTNNDTLSVAEKDKCGETSDEENDSPLTIDCFMTACRLENYVEQMKASGWDDVQFLDDVLKDTEGLEKLKKLEFPITKIGHIQKFQWYLSRTQDKCGKTSDDKKILFPTIDCFMTTCKLENYVEQMKASGWDDVEFLVDVVKDTADLKKLKEFPITLIGHMQKFVWYLSRLA